MAVDVEFLNGNNVNNINNNFQRVKNALQEVVGRNGNLPNHMNADLDMNSNDILNVDRVDLQRIVVDGEEFDPRQMRGWAPVFSAIEYNGTVVMKLIDYVGGQGIKPTQYIGWYIGNTGYVQDINQATGFGSSGITDGDKGDITVSSSGTVWDLNKNFDTVSELLSDESMGYLGSGSPTTVSSGDIVTAQGFRYEVAASGATDAHVETAGGVKLNVLASSKGFDLPAFGVSDGQAGNIPQYVKYLAAQAPFSTPRLPITREVPKPKLHLFSSIAAGKAFHGFPSAVRHDGKDYVLYREGTGHIEANPVVGAAARLVCSTRQVNAIAPDSRTVIYAPSAIDPRDPNVLRDDSGSAILVGGKFKVVIFEWNSTYSVATAKVFDLDPANLAAGLTNPVTIPTIKAVKSDVRLLSNGSYAFVGYDLTNTCYLVTTTDWVTFNTEVIGPGNEAALCETHDGYLNVIVRAEENFGHCVTIFYKKNLSSGGWYIHSILPYTLNAPTLVKGQDIRVISTAPGGNEGWLLFARDKTGRTALTNFTEPTSELVCFRSKEDFGRTITRFIDRKTIAGTANGGLASSGDGHYCSVVAGKYSGQLDIYTYGEFRTAFDNASTTFSIMVWRLEAEMSPDEGVRVVSRKKRNYVRNASFEQGTSGYDLSNPNSALIVDGGRSVLRLSDVISSQFPNFVVDCEAGETLFLKLRTKLNFSNLAGTGRHIQWAIADYSTGTAVLIQTETPNPNPLDFFGVWRDIICRPFIAPSSRLLVSLSTVASIVEAETDVAHVEISDDYSSDLNPGDRVTDIITSQVALNFPTSPTGGAKTSGTYSNNFWDLFGLPKKSSGVPLAAKSLGDITVILSNCTTDSGAVKVICTGVVVNSNGSVTADFAVAPGESGTMSAQVSAKATVAIKV